MPCNFSKSRTKNTYFASSCKTRNYLVGFVFKKLKQDPITCVLRIQKGGLVDQVGLARISTNLAR